MAGTMSTKDSTRRFSGSTIMSYESDKSSIIKPSNAWRTDSLTKLEKPENPFWSAEDEEDEAFRKEKSRPKSYLQPEEPFHIFTKSQTWAVVLLVGIAGMFSGLSANIYFPSLDAISKEFRVSLGEVNSTITSFLIFQGLSPLFWGPLSDTLGRRPIYLASFTVYVIANTVLSFSPNFIILVLFRALQSAGSASTASIGNGVISDITTPLDRGAYVGFYQAGKSPELLLISVKRPLINIMYSVRNFSIAIGPVIGGVLAHFFGFRSVFIFLAIASVVMSAMLIVFLPETLRSVAGNGTIKLKGIYQPLIRTLTKDPDYMREPEPGRRKDKVTPRTFLEPLLILKDKDMMIVLGYGGVVYAVWNMLVATTTDLFKKRFQLDELTLGLVFIPNGLGTVFGSYVAGALMTRDFKQHEQAYLRAHPGAPPPSRTSSTFALDFPIEHARLRQLPWLTLVAALATGLYGFSVLQAADVEQHLLPFDLLPPGAAAALRSPAWIAVPLALQFLVSAAANAVFSVNQTLVADLHPRMGAGVTAVNNMVRCGAGAAGVAVVDPMLRALGPAGTFLTLAVVVLASSLSLVLEWCNGMRWRGEKEAGARRAREEAAGMDVEKR